MKDAQCPLCPYLVDSDAEMAAHLLKQHAKSYGIFPCPCGDWFGGPVALAKHLREHGGAMVHFTAAALGVDKYDGPPF